MTIFDSPASGTPDNGPAPDAGVAAPVSPAPDAGAPGEALAPPVAAEAPAAPTPSYFDPSQYNDHLVKLKVAGEDVEMSVADALKGAMRQQDYTRKTQELAEERRKLHQADALAAMLDADPVATLKQLSDVYDVDPVQGFAPIERSPEEQQLRGRERALAAQQEAITRQQIEHEAAQLQAQFGDSFDLYETARYARENGLRLPQAYKLMQFDRQQAQQKDDAVNEARREAARAASNAVHNGGTTQKGTVTAPPPQVNSLRDAWELAKQQLKA